MEKIEYDAFGNCTACGGGEEGSIAHMLWCSAENEGLNPRIFCGEGIPRGEKEIVDISTIPVR